MTIAIISKISNTFLDIFFPKRCIECGKEGNFVCFSCAGEIELIKTLTCPFCGKISKYGNFCPSCKMRTKVELTGLITAACYDTGPTKEMIHHLKYSGFAELADSLSELCSLSLKNNLPPGPLVIVPVPLHQKREAERGFNQAELIARQLSVRFDIAGGCALARIKNTETQVKLNKKLRSSNLLGAFSCTDPELICGKNVLLIDDVATTLSTLDECAKVLKEAGAKKVWGVVVARRI